MKKKFIILSIILFLSLNLAAVKKEQEDFINNIFVFDNFLMENLPGGYFTGFYLENYASGATLLIEENNGFSYFDNPRVYFEGDSFLDFNWYYNGFKTNSALNNGNTAIIFPFSSYSSYSLNGESPVNELYGLEMMSKDHGENFSRIFLSSVYGDLGSYSFLGPIMVQPEHASLRDEMLYNTRRRVKNNYFIDYMYNRSFNKGIFTFSFNHLFLKREFNDFNDFDTIFSENSNIITISSRYKRYFKKGFIELTGAFNTLKRDNLYAELGRFPEETLNLERDSYFSGIKLRIKSTEIKLSFIHEKEKFVPAVKDFSKDIFDNDGGDIFPENRIGDISSNIINLNINTSLIRANGFTALLYSDGRFSEISGNEIINDHNALFAGNAPYQVILWEDSHKYTNYNLSLVTGLNLTLKLNKNYVLHGKLSLNYNDLKFEYKNNNINSIKPGFDLGISRFGKNSGFLLSFGISPGNLNENINSFLETSRPSATIYNWNDQNNDNIFQSGEEGQIYGYSGGKYHFLDPGLKTPEKKRLMFIYSTKISKNFIFNLKGLYKKVKNNFWIKFFDNYGNYELVNNENLYFYDQPYKDYYLSNYDFEKDPFYAELLINFTGRIKERWFFSFSFMAHMGMGYTSFGNGANSNDTGILNESMADPNYWINGYGRVDGDRGFVSKLYFGYHLSKNLFLGVSFKYRDGDPFAFLNSVYKNDQWIIYYKTIQAENEKGVKGGPREDYVSDMSLKLSYSFRFFNKRSKLSLSVFNILDFGSEISEYVFSGGDRLSMELQIPRSVRLNLQIEI